VTKDRNRCLSTDTVVDASLVTSVPIYLTLDLYNSVQVSDSGPQGSILTHVNDPIPTLGSLGSAVHLSSTTGTGATKAYSEATVVFTPAGTLQWITMNTMGIYSSNAGRSGNCGVQVVTGTYKGSQLCLNDSSLAGTGTTTFPIGAECSPGSCTAGRGLVSLVGWKQAVTNTVTSGCVDDTSGSISNNIYVGGNCTKDPLVGSITYTIVRVVDPSNIMGVCTSGYVTGQTGTCAGGTTFGIQTDGYN
jgi:hypothetical protein